MSNASLRFTISGYIIFIAKAAPLIVIPILTYKLSNWWLLFGILFAYAAISVTYLRAKYLVFSLLLIAFIIYCYLNGFNIRQPVSFFFLCFSVNFILLIIYRIIGFGDKASRAMIAAMGNRLANAEIDKDVEKGMAIWRAGCVRICLEEVIIKASPPFLETVMGMKLLEFSAFTPDCLGIPSCSTAQ